MRKLKQFLIISNLKQDKCFFMIISICSVVLYSLNTTPEQGTSSFPTHPSAQLIN